MHRREVIELAAQICHEANRAYCLTLGDDTQQPWANAPEWQRTSAVNGVLNAMKPETKPSDSHESWLREKQATGWTYGPVKDETAKTHPCCVPYDELPAEQRVKDVLFLNVARAVLAALQHEP
jgi:hypothetical protein